MDIQDGYSTADARGEMLTHIALLKAVVEANMAPDVTFQALTLIGDIAKLWELRPDELKAIEPWPQDKLRELLDAKVAQKVA